jgi:Na+/phosphate symporter
MLALAATENPALAPLSAGTSLLVTLLALGMAFVALRARRQRNNPALILVGIAFLVFAAKNAFSAYNVLAHERAGWFSVPHDEIELVLSLTDLAIMLLLFAPLLLRRRG